MYCKKCHTKFLDKEKFDELSNDKCVNCLFIKGNENSFDNIKKEKIKKQQMNERNIQKKKDSKISIFILKDIYKHKCNNINFVKKEAKKDIEEYVTKEVDSYVNRYQKRTKKIKVKEKRTCKCTLYYCKGCNKYYATPELQNEYLDFKSDFKFYDYNIYMESNKKDYDDIKININDYIVKDNEPLTKLSKSDEITESDFYKIIEDIKKSNKFDFIVKSSTRFCTNNNHKIIDTIALIDIVNKYGEIRQLKCSANYCADCDVHFISNFNYERIRDKGVPLCKIYDLYKLKSVGEYYQMNSESIMHMFGYNVNANENLTTFQRHIILENLLENGILSKHEILSHLNYLYNRSSSLKNFKQARSRWKEDIDFVENININRNININVSSIKKIHYM